MSESPSRTTPAHTARLRIPLHVHALQQDTLFTCFNLVCNNDEVTSNNAESFNNSTSLPVRREPVGRLCISLLTQEQQHLVEGQQEARALCGRRSLVPCADAMFNEECKASVHYDVQSW